ncbi:MAG TPA: hypothetical protein VGC88_12990 [Terriglobales bacterium]|jgi:hypothetical protein
MNPVRQFAALITLAASCLFLAGCPQGKDIAQEVRTNLQSPSGEPHILAAYQPWFGRDGHINVGYSTQDPSVLQHQVREAQELGISAFVANWYGQSRRFEDSSYATLQRVAAQNDFQVAIMYDESGDDRESSTNDTINDLNYAYERYFGPNAGPSGRAYMTINGRPVIFVFPKSGKTDWRQVRQAMQSWERQPIIIYKDHASDPSQFDGFFAWVNPGREGWQRDGSNWGRDYLEDFYERMTQRFPDKIAVGGAWPAFDDSRASWGRNRHMSSRCGRTMEESLKTFRRYYDNNRPLPFLMIDTWNDYEEGTAIERGIGCNGHNIRLTSNDGGSRNNGE